MTTLWLGSHLIATLWGVWVVYWMISARHVKPTERRESRLSRWSYTLPLLAGTFLLIAPGAVPLGSLDERVLPRTICGYWLGVALLAGGIGLMVWARRHLGANWSGTVTLKEGHELVQTGPYRRIRHPIYTGLLAAFLGMAVAADRWISLLAFAVVGASILHKLSIEERWLTERFGKGYARYRARAGMLIPK